MAGTSPAKTRKAIGLSPPLRPFARPSEARRYEHLGAADHRGVFAVEMGERQRVNLGRLKVSIADPDVGRPAGVGDDESAIAEIAGVAGGRFERIVGEDAAQHQGRRAETVERFLERRADESAVRALADDDFALERLRLGLESMAGRTWRIRRAELGRIVSDMDDRQRLLPPDGDERGDGGFRARVVAGETSADRRSLVGRRPRLT